MVRGWEPANFDPNYKNFADAGWNKYEHDGREISNLYINNSESPPQLAAVVTPVEKPPLAPVVTSPPPVTPKPRVRAVTLS